MEKSPEATGGAYGTFLARNDDGSVDVVSGGRKMRVAMHPDLDEADLTRGAEVVLNESLNVGSPGATRSPGRS